MNTSATMRKRSSASGVGSLSHFALDHKINEVVAQLNLKLKNIVTALPKLSLKPRDSGAGRAEVPVVRFRGTWPRTVRLPAFTCKTPAAPEAFLMATLRCSARKNFSRNIWLRYWWSHEHAHHSAVSEGSHEYSGHTHIASSGQN